MSRLSTLLLAVLLFAYLSHAKLSCSDLELRDSGKPMSTSVFGYFTIIRLDMWSYVSCEETSDSELTVTSNGVPPHVVGLYPDFRDTNNDRRGDNPNLVVPVWFRWRLPRTVTLKDSNPEGAVNSTDALFKGPVGFTVQGTPFFSMYTGYDEDAVKYETMDLCYGHPSEDGSWHHHYIMSDKNCLFEDKSGEFSPIIGWAFDGIPLYGPQGTGGALPTDLDACNGKNYSDIGYVYHTSNEKPPYTIGCYKGTPLASSYAGIPVGLAAVILFNLWIVLLLVVIGVAIISVVVAAIALLRHLKKKQSQPSRTKAGPEEDGVEMQDMTAA